MDRKSKNNRVEEIESVKNTIIFNDNYIRHYTCNSPKEEILKKYTILPIGKMHGFNEDRELLLIPIALCEKVFGKIKKTTPLTINCENLLKRIEEKFRK